MLTVKVALMIASQLLCWIPFILTTLYFEYLAEQAAPPMVFEIFFLVTIPLNSLLNPLFYSNMYKKVANKLSVKWREFVGFVTDE